MKKKNILDWVKVLKQKLVLQATLKQLLDHLDQTPFLLDLSLDEIHLKLGCTANFEA